MVEITIDEPYIESTLMVGNENITLIFINVFPSLHFDPHAKDEACKMRPNMSRPVTPEILMPEDTTEGCDNGSKYRRQDEDWSGDQILIDKIKKAKYLFHLLSLLLLDCYKALLLYYAGRLLGIVGSDQLIASAMDVDDLDLRIIFEKFAELGDIHIHAASIEIVVVNPY